MVSTQAALPLYYEKYPTVIGLDFDGTVSRDVRTWVKVIELLKSVGHTVYLVTMRYPSEGRSGMVPIPWEIVNEVHGVIFTSRKAKRPTMEALGIHVDVWIDDEPRAINHNAVEIWGMETPEGVIVTPEYPETHPLKPIID
jgi:hypothetical protein